MSTIDYSHLRLLAIFSTVVETGSFAGAARKLNSSRSRISEQISSLESDLGVRLLQRSTRQLKMTEEGQQVYQYAPQLPEILQAIEAIVKPETPKGRVSLTTTHDIAHKYILPILPDFQQRYPDVRIDLLVSDERSDLIGEQIDLGIRVGIPKDESLIARVLHEESFTLFASPSYLGQYGEPKTIDDLEQHRWILLKQAQQNNILLHHHDQALQLQFKDCYYCNSPLLQQQMVVQGLGISLLLPSTMQSEIKEGFIKPIMPSLTSQSLVFSLIYPSRRQVPLRTRVVIDYLLNANIFTSTTHNKL